MQACADRALRAAAAGRGGAQGQPGAAPAQAEVGRLVTHPRRLRARLLPAHGAGTRLAQPPAPGGSAAACGGVLGQAVKVRLLTQAGVVHTRLCTRQDGRRLCSVQQSLLFLLQCVHAQGAKP